MKPSLRFLALVVIGWAGVRLAAAGSLPSLSFFSVARSEAKPAPPLVQTQFPPIDPVEPTDTPAAAPQASIATPAAAPQTAPTQIRPAVYYYSVRSVRVPLPPAHSTQLTNVVPTPRAGLFADFPLLSDAPMSRMASVAMAEQRSSVVVVPAIQSVPALPTKKVDRIQASAWALLRSSRGQVLGPSSLASGGQLGGSQAGGRLLYNFNRQIAASLRTTSDVGRRGFEVAAGVRVQPFVSLPVWITAERRQRVGKNSTGRNDFAIFAESGLYQRPLPGHFSLDAYLQAGVVGVKTRDLFIDGALAMTRPVYKKFSAGFGVWGGAQPGLYRLDVGPRITMKVRKNIRVHFDWRQKLAGNAQPGSGPAVTLAGDF